MRHSREQLKRVSAACYKAALDGRLRHRPAVEPENDPHFQAAIRRAKVEHAATRQDADAGADVAGEADDPAPAAVVPKRG